MENAVFCARCGNAVAQPPNAYRAGTPTGGAGQPTGGYNQPVGGYNQPVGGFGQSVAGIMGRIKTDRKLMYIIGASVIAVIALIVILAILPTSSGKEYQKALDTFISVFYEGETEQWPGLYPQEAKDKFGETDLNDYFYNYSKYYWQEIDKYCGGDESKYHIAYDIVSETEVQGDDFEEIRQGFYNYYKIDWKTITKMYAVTLNVTKTTGDFSDDGDDDLAFIKIGDEWYCLRKYQDEHYDFYHINW